MTRDRKKRTNEPGNVLPQPHSRGITCLVGREHEKALVWAGHVTKNNNFATYLGVFCHRSIGMDDKDLTASA